MSSGVEVTPEYRVALKKKKNTNPHPKPNKTKFMGQKENRAVG